MKVFYLPLNGGVRPQTGMEQAMDRAGFERQSFDYMKFFEQTGQNNLATNEQLLYVARKFLSKNEKAWMHMQLQETNMIDPLAIKALRYEFPNLFITQWTGDIRDYAPVHYVDIGKYCHLNLISSVGQIDMFRRMGLDRVEYWQVGYEPEIFHPIEVKEDERQRHFYRVGGLMNRHGNFPGERERYDLVHKFSTTINDFCVWGQGWSSPMQHAGAAYNADANIIMNLTGVLIGNNNYNDVEQYYSDRYLTHTASGACFIGKRIPGLEKDFEDGKHMLMWDTIDECMNKYREVRNNLEVARRIGRAGAKHVKKHHCYDARIAEMVDRLGWGDDVHG